MKGDTRAEGLDPLGEPGRTMDLASNPKGRGYPNIARPGGIDKTEGREEMFARRTPKWASRPASCMKSRSICASSNVLAASVDPFLLAEEGEVSLSPFAP